MPIRGSPNGAVRTRPQPGRDRSQQLVAINRNAWSQSKSVVAISRCAHEHRYRARVAGVAGVAKGIKGRLVVIGDEWQKERGGRIVAMTLFSKTAYTNAY
jgi:hypothetical protein